MNPAAYPGTCQFGDVRAVIRHIRIGRLESATLQEAGEGEHQ